MEIKLIVNGGDHRIRITPKGKADEKLLEFIAQWDIGRLSVTRSQYGRDINSIDLCFENESIDPDTGKEMDLPIADAKSNT